MAKKAKKAEAEDGAPAEAPKGKKKLLMIGGLAAVLVLGGGGGAFMMLGGKGHGDGHGDGHGAAHAETAAPVAFLDVREMTVNLAPERNEDRLRSLRFRVSLEMKDAKALAEATPLLPRIEDALQVYTRELRASDLEGSAGVFRLREELLRRVNAAVYPAKANAVLFKDMIVQ
jgi:flagellar protein FliL